MVTLDVNLGRDNTCLSSDSHRGSDFFSQARTVWVPENEDHLIAQIPFQTSPMRAIGRAAAVQSQLDLSPGTLISLERLSGLVNIDDKAKTATFWAGTLLSDVHKILREHDLALISSPDENDQTLGEAVSLAGHGSGRLGCLSAYVKAMRLISPEGLVFECDATTNPRLFQAARADLGLLGVVSQVTLYSRDSYRLKESIRVIPLNELLGSLEGTDQACRHTECWVFPWSNEVVMRQMEETLEPLTELDASWNADDWCLKRLAWLNQYVPTDHLPWLKRLKWLVPHTQRIGWAHDIIPKSGVYASNDLEYSVSLTRAQSVMFGLLNAFREMKKAPMCPLHVRWVARDDIWLSPFYGSDQLSISLLSGDTSGEMVNRAGRIFTAHKGRSAWTMPRLMSVESCAAVYPKWADFLMVRQSLDPHNKMVNANLRHLFLRHEL